MFYATVSLLTVHAIFAENLDGTTFDFPNNFYPIQTIDRMHCARMKSRNQLIGNLRQWIIIFVSRPDFVAPLRSQ